MKWGEKGREVKNRKFGVTSFLDGPLLNSILCLQGFSVRQVELKKESSSVYVTLGFAGIALVAAMVVGVVVLKRRNGRHPHHQVRPRPLS